MPLPARARCAWAGPASARPLGAGRLRRPRRRPAPAPVPRTVRARRRRPRPDRRQPNRGATPADPGRGSALRHLRECGVDVPSILRPGGAVDDSPHERMPEPKPRPDLQEPATTAGSAAPGPIPSRARRPRRASGRRRVPPPTTSRSACCPPATGSAAAESSPRSGPRPTPPSGSPNPPASAAAVHARGSSSKGERVAVRLGDDPVADGLVESPGQGRREERARHRLRQRRHDDLGQPGQVAVIPLLADGKDHDDALGPSRRATKPSTCADAWSSQWTSSTKADSGCVSATSASRLRTASPTRNRSGGAPSSSPKPCAAHVAGAPAGARAVEERRAELMEPGEGQLHLGLDARGTHDPAAELTKSSSRAVLPTPGSPRRTTTPLVPSRARAINV